MISDIGLWATCEASALHGDRAPGRRTAVALVAELAHGAEPGAGQVAFDRVTPTVSVARRQAYLVRDGVAREMDGRGWRIEKRLEKRPAFVVRTKEGDAGVAGVRLDRVGTAWLEAGGLIESLDRVSFAAVLVVDRAKVSRYGFADVEVTARPAARVLHAYRVLAERRAAVLEGAAPMHAPGIHCARCRLADCPVRSQAGPGGVT